LPRTYDPEVLVEGALAGDRAAVARLISMVEQGGDAAHAAIAKLYPQAVSFSRRHFYSHAVGEAL